MPPCAYELALSSSDCFVSSTTSPGLPHCSAARHAVCRPATPLPITRTRVWSLWGSDERELSRAISPRSRALGESAVMHDADICHPIGHEVPRCGAGWETPWLVGNDEPSQKVAPTAAPFF